MANSAPVNKSALSLIIFFAVVTALLLLFKKQLQLWGINQPVVIVGNMILFAVSLASFLLYQRAMSHPTTMGFLRNTYSGLFLKLMVCVFAILIYVMMDREHVNKPGIFVCVFLYFIYTLLEMRSLLQWNKARRNA
jgi:hypothetical protein